MAAIAPGANPSYAPVRVLVKKMQSLHNLCVITSYHTVTIMTMTDINYSIVTLYLIIMSV